MELSFEYWADRWYDASAFEVKETTHYGYGGIVRELKNRFNEMPIIAITPKEIQELLTEMHQQGRAKSTINKRKYVIQLIFRFASISGAPVSNPCTFTKAPRLATKSVRRGLTPAETQMIIQNIAEGMFGLYAFCLLFLGLRRSEMLALCWEDINFIEGFIHIDKVVTFLKSRPRLEYVLKNGWRARLAPMPSILHQELQRQYHGQRGLIFSLNGELLNENYINRGWANYRDKVGLDGVTQHMVRHTYTTMLYDAQIDIKAAAALLGHSDERTTLMIYTHIDKERTARKAIGQLNSWIDKTFPL